MKITGIRRRILRKILGILTRLTIRKHKSQIVAVTGTGPSTLLKELIYNIISQKYSARRNLERTESEFSIPLTVIGTLTYPKSNFEWIKLIIKTFIQLVYIRPYPHFLVIQMNYIDEQIFKYWIKILNPVAIIDTEDADLSQADKLDIPIAIQNLCQRLEIKPADIKAGLADTICGNFRIKLIPSINDSVIIDARHFYYPPNIDSVMEIADAIPSDHKFIISHVKTDIINIPNKGFDFMDSIKNLDNYPKNSIYIFRGRRDEFVEDIRAISLNKSEI